ncbi:hypothetical protein DE146DRAFT_652760 [Phaeosphaeria sp. MPI-PUGE-AT-0046c]|nr:hypothetical protein DE146DRAFT_652760 [Phaeosphaeria sp. MPI-PUGE-AT-0046c]
MRNIHTLLLQSTALPNRNGLQELVLGGSRPSPTQERNYPKSITTQMDSFSSSQNTRGHDRGRGRGQGRGRGRGQQQLSSRGQSQSQAPPFRSRGRGRAYFPRPPFRDPNQDRPVPAYASIHPSTPVRMILKQDQPTGHTVTGVVADLLTRGNHPRGVKVRLRDGRVGRVQAIVSQEEGEAGERLVGGADASLDRNGGEGGGVGCGGGSGRGGARMRGGRVERDIRDEDEYLYDESKQGDRANEGIFGALEEADRRHAAQRSGEVEGGEVVTCPVCMVFKGDERAVQHHVEMHYVDQYK